MSYGSLDMPLAPNTEEERRRASLAVVRALGRESRPVLEALGLAEPKKHGPAA